LFRDQSSAKKGGPGEKNRERGAQKSSIIINSTEVGRRLYEIQYLSVGITTFTTALDNICDKSAITSSETECLHLQKFKLTQEMQEKI
jgi:hypothetical protein